MQDTITIQMYVKLYKSVLHTLCFPKLIQLAVDQIGCEFLILILKVALSSMVMDSKTDDLKLKQGFQPWKPSYNVILNVL